MGQEKQRWMERMEDEASAAKAEWIREHLDNAEANENTEGWTELADQYDAQDSYEHVGVSQYSGAD
jgi:hypothetical protein